MPASGSGVFKTRKGEKLNIYQSMIVTRMDITLQLEGILIEVIDILKNLKKNKEIKLYLKRQEKS